MKHFAEKLKALWARPAAKWIAGLLFVLLCGVGLVYYWRVAYSFSAIGAGLATALVCGGFSVLYLLVWLTAHFIPQDFAKKGAILIFAAGLAFVFANPPLQAPDETMHFLRGYSIASGQFAFDQNEDFPADVDLLVRDFPGNYNFALPMTDTSSIADAFARYEHDLENNVQDAPNATTPVQQFLPYLPAAAGMAVGRLFGADALVCMYLGRIANLLCYSLLCFASLRAARRFKSLLIAVECVPIGLFLAASTSSDAVLLGLQWLFVGICLSDGLTRRRAAALAVSFAVLLISKYNYLAMLPLLWLLPAKNALPAAEKKAPWYKRQPILAAMLLCFAAAGIYYALVTAHNAWFNNYTALEYYDPGVRPMDQLRFILSNPARYIAVFLYSVYLNKGELFSIGVFGWRDMVVPFVSYFAPVVLCIAASFTAWEAAREPAKTGWLFAVSGALLYAFTYTGMYLTSTPYTMVQIVGVQTRYLLPAILSLMVLLATCAGRSMQLQHAERRRPQKTAPEWRMAHLVFVFAVVSALLLFQSYYIGA